MRPLAAIVLRASGLGRAAVVAATTAVVSGLLLVAVSIVRLPTESRYSSYGAEHLLSPIADPGTRPGVVVAVVLMLVPLLLLLDQAVRLGSTARRRRYAALAVAGATRTDLRRWSALEVGAPAALGAVLGVPTWLLLRELLGQALHDHQVGALVPTTVGPGAWALLVVVAVAAYGVLAGRRAGSRMAAVLGEARGLRPAPRPWPALLLVAGIAVLLASVPLFNGSEVLYLALTFTSLLLLVAGAAGLAPWAAYRTASRLAARASSAATLLAARRLTADPRSTARAAAAVGGVAMTTGVLGSFVADIRAGVDSYDQESYLVPAAVVGVCVVVALGLVAVSLALHSAESFLERRRELAALAATGVPVAVMTAAQRRECLVATVPLAVVLGPVSGIGYALLGGVLGPVTVAGTLLATAATVVAVVAAVAVTTRLLRPWLLEAMAAEQLRTE